LQDVPPRFPIPNDILPDAASLSIQIDPVGRLLKLCHRQDLTLAIKELQCLNQLIENELVGRDLWGDGVFAGLYLVPVLHRRE
jgi:hypothetical protein